ncbi:MAG TPA: hypothetical protein CFH81_02245 [Sulfurovum sp. UBA12169]|nr:MAG TPA: hypothetical protein CFH81_02245 [Sulfurovum sp. UBA12169]
MERAKRELPPMGSQGRTVYEHLKKGNRLTSLEAIHEFGILRLPNRISELRHKYGVEIFQRTVHKKENKKVKWEEYSLSPIEEA